MRGSDTLAVDVGTSSLKLGLYRADLVKRLEVRIPYAYDLHHEGMADVDPDVWWKALRQASSEVANQLSDVGLISLSVTTPGLTAMAADGTALAPAILFLDGRSHRQAAEIRKLVGNDRFLRETCNLPVSGGSSLASILWFRDERPDIWRSAAMFGHCNTYMVKRLTGEWAIDPSTTSITGLYNTVRNDLTWNETVLELSGIDERRLPTLLHSHQPVGTILPDVAAELSLPTDVVVLAGGNDATLAALSSGLTEPGDINIISGTCDIANVCTDHPVASPNYNVRCHVLPGRWLTFFVLNTGGAALEWFRQVLASEIGAEAFYTEYVPRVLREFFGNADLDRREATLPGYVPYLGGSRYALERQTAALSNVTLETTRDDLLLAVIRGNAEYLAQHLREVGAAVPLSSSIGISGGGARIDGMLEARRRWTGQFEYRYQEQSSLLGAAMLAQMHQQDASAGASQIAAKPAVRTPPQRAPELERSPS